MKRRIFESILIYLFTVFFSFQGIAQERPSAEKTVFNVKDFGASGKKADNSRAAIQAAVDSCAKAGGGKVYLPPGEYTSGTIHLRSGVRFFIEAGATLFASRDKKDYDKEALFYGEDLESITLEGRGIVDGQAEYEWRWNDLDDAYIRDNMLLMQSLGKPLVRSFPKKNATPKMVLLLRSKDVRITGLSFLHSPSWNIHPYGCERMVIDGVYIYSSLKEAVWADGIDPDGCKDLRISNSTIETGDDALVFYSMNWFGPALPCENITVTNCRLSSASSALKFCDGNMNCIRKVTVSNCVITDSNRGIAFMVFDGGTVSDVVISDLTVECRRHDWFWWGDGDPFHFNIKRRSEVHSQVKKEDEPPAGSIRNVLIQNIIARGKGTSFVNGHPQSWLDGITFKNIKLFLSSDPASPYQKGENGFKFQWAKDLKLEDVEVVWEKPERDRWQNALYFEDVRGLELENFTGRQAKLGAGDPAMIFHQVEQAKVQNSKAKEGTSVFLQITGNKSRQIYLIGNDLLESKIPYRLGTDVNKDEVHAENNIIKKQ